MRTNAFQPGRDSLSLKIRSADVPDMPEPFPLFEIYVYAPTVEGIHLRGGLVARGGIRWSSRLEDYRTEVRGLMKAQRTKNAIIQCGVDVYFDKPVRMQAIRQAISDLLTQRGSSNGE